MSEHGPELIELFVYCIAKKVFENVWLMMSGIFMFYILYWKATQLERNVIANFETEDISVYTHYCHLCLAFLFLVVTLSPS